MPEIRCHFYRNRYCYCCIVYRVNLSSVVCVVCVTWFSRSTLRQVERPEVVVPKWILPAAVHRERRLCAHAVPPGHRRVLVCKSKWRRDTGYNHSSSQQTRLLATWCAASSVIDYPSYCEGCQKIVSQNSRQIELRVHGQLAMHKRETYWVQPFSIFCLLVCIWNGRR